MRSNRLFDLAVKLLAGLALGLVAIALVDFLLHPQAGDYNFHSPIFRAVVMLLFTPLNLMIAFLIIRRVPGNVVGPLLILWSATVSYGSMREDIAPLVRSLFFGYDLVFGWLALFVMVIHFPDGRIFPPAATRWIYRLLALIMLTNSLIFLSSEFLQGPSQIVNPFYLPVLHSQADIILSLGLLFFAPLLLLALITPVLRYRKGGTLERQQIKWLALFAGSTVIYTLLGLILYPLINGGEVMNPGTTGFAVIFYLMTSLFPPLSIGVAVLRHRLWDIDLIIRRTLVYAILTVIITLIYFGGVVVIQEIFRLITDQQQSPVATVISTLGSAALFTPLRRRIQERIDLRFYRQKYNAERVLEGLSTSLRNEVDMDRLKLSIVGVVKETMQPTEVVLWLRGDERLPVRRQVEDNLS